MTTKTFLAGKDGHVSQGSPSEWFGSDAYLRIRGGSSEQRRVFIWFPVPVPTGATVVSATLTLRVRTTAFNGQTITARRVTSSWNTPTWNNQPNTTATNEASSGATTAAVGTDVTIPVTGMIADVAAGSAWYGVRLTLGTDVLRQFNSREATSGGPTLTVEYTQAPLTPTDLRPSENRAVSLAQPTLAWGLLGPGAQAEAQVQVDNDSDFSSPTWDSGWVAQTNQQMQVGASLAAGAYYWRVRVRDSAGVTSDWASAQFQRVVKGTLTITNPPNAGTVETTTPPVTHTFSGTQTAAEREVYQDGVLRHKAYESGTGTSWDVPPGVITLADTPLRVVVRVWDNVSREATPGDPIYTEQESAFEFSPNAVGAPTDLTATSGASPVITFEFQRSSAPAFFSHRVDGVLVSDRLNPADLLVSGTTYRYHYYGATPGVEQTHEIGAVVLSGGEYRETTPNPTVAHTLDMKGIWLLSPALELDCVIVGHEAPDIVDAESADTLFPASWPIRITDGVRGMEGTIRGQLTNVLDRTADEWRERFRTIKRQASDIRLAFGTDNIPVVLGEAEMPLLPPADPTRYGFSCEFWQVGE